MTCMREGLFHDCKQFTKVCAISVDLLYRIGDIFLCQGKVKCAGAKLRCIRIDRQIERPSDIS